MPTYQVERRLVGADMESLAAIRRAAKDACRVLTAAGRPVRYLRSTFVPGESRCRCLFEAASGDLVQEANDVAQLPYSRIVLAVDLLSIQPTERPP